MVGQVVKFIISAIAHPRRESDRPSATLRDRIFDLIKRDSRNCLDLPIHNLINKAIEFSAV